MRYIVGLLFFTICVYVGVFGIGSYEHVRFEQALRPPSLQYWFGTDHLGRDVAFQTVVGLANSLALALLVRTSALGVAIVLGSVAGFVGGFVDSLIMRVVDTMLAFPDLLLAIGLSVAFGEPTRFGLLVVLVLVSWPSTTRVIRSKVLASKEQLYIEAARALGGSERYIWWRHIVRECRSIGWFLFLLGFGATIMTEASLSFLGLGLVSTPTLGALIQQGFPYLLTAPWIALFPAGVLGVVVFLSLEYSVDRRF